MNTTPSFVSRRSIVAVASLICLAVPALTMAQNAAPVNPQQQPQQGTQQPQQSQQQPSSQQQPQQQPSNPGIAQPQFPPLDPNAPAPKPIKPPASSAKNDPNYIAPAVNPNYYPLPKPGNPLIMNDLTTKTGNQTVYYDQTGRMTSPPLPDASGAVNPDAGTQFADPALLDTEKTIADLPLFGYDFFAAPRQLITARQLYLQRRYQMVLVPTTQTSRPTPYGMTTSQQPNQNSTGNQYGPGQPIPSLDPYNNQPSYQPTTTTQPLSRYPSRTSQQLPSTANIQPLDPYKPAVDPYSTWQSSTNPDIVDLSAPPQTGTRSTNPSMNNDSQQGIALGAYPQAQYDPNTGNVIDTNTNTPLSNVPGAPQLRRGMSPYGQQQQVSTPSPYYSSQLGQVEQPQQQLPFDMMQTNPSIDAFHEVADPMSQLFRNVQQSLPPDYQLNPGDTLTIRTWSATIPMREVSATIDSRGFIYMNDIGPQVVRGLSAAQAENLLRLKLRRMYRNMDVSISLKELRTMAVTVSGTAFAPGTYTVPAGTTAFNLLYVAGGPSTDGSLRAIEVRRHGAVAGTIDMYTFILGKGSDKADMVLQPGDVVYIPPHLARVSARGEVRRPAIYEVMDNEVLSDIVRFAGGVKPSGVTQHIQVSTFAPGQSRILKDVNLTDKAQQALTPLYDGDDIDIFSISSLIVNRVTLGGAVKQPGDYAIEPGMKLSDLIARARGLKDDAYTTRADVYRWNADNTTTLIPVDLDKSLAHDALSDIVLARWDRVRIYTRQEVMWTGRREVTVRGAVQRPGTYYRSDNLHVKDLLMQAGGPIPEAYLNRAVLLHQHPDGSFSYDYVDVAAALKDGGDPGPEILDNDVFAVYKVGEAQFTPDHTVSIRGRVVAPGIYPRGEGMRLSDLLHLSGGFIRNAAFRLQVTHVPKSNGTAAARTAAMTVDLDAQHNFAKDQDSLLQDGDVVTVQGIGGVYDTVRIVTVAGSVNRPGPVAIREDMKLSDAIREAGGLLPDAYAQGAEFIRDPTLLTTANQQALVTTIKDVNDLLNADDFRRLRAKSDIDRLKAISTVSQPDNNVLSIIPGAAATQASVPLPAGTTTSLQQRDLVTPARALQPADLVPNGNIAIDLAQAIRRPGSDDDIKLMDGDTLTVPTRPTTVQVVGAVYNARGVLFEAGASIDFYINQAGGLSPDAARDRIEIIHAGGGLILASKAHQLEPGDIILVPTKVLAASIDSHRHTLDDTIKSITNSAILVAIISKLIP